MLLLSHLRAHLRILLFTLGLPAGSTMPMTLAAQEVAANGQKDCYRVYLTDKKGCGYKTGRPEAFLSPKAIERRRRYGLKVDHHDLPLTPAYLDSLRHMGLTVRLVSKWNNTAVVEVGDTALLAPLRRLPFVKDVCLVWQQPPTMTPGSHKLMRDKANALRHNLVKPFGAADSLYAAGDSTLLGFLKSIKQEDHNHLAPKPQAHYMGLGHHQAAMLGVDAMHKQGYTGRGVTIAVMDAGFFNADIIPGLKEANVLGTRNYVTPGRSVYEGHSHGMEVLSCIAARSPHRLVGTAPDAAFYLLVTEDTRSEQMIEEDNWCAALEYADSLGCDIVTSSLGYTHFDHKDMKLTYTMLDGRTHLNSRSASLAASRGLLVVNSAGNEGGERWKKMGIPADAPDILTVGAVDSTGVNTDFSSVGHTADGRIKPDVMAMGEDVYVYDITGLITRVGGTSFSCPLTCGAAACLMQAFPNKRPTDLIDALRRTASRADHPDNIYGYGLPDLTKAAEMLRKK